MKKQLTLFIVCQMLFVLLFGLITMTVETTDGLQPFGKTDEMISVNLNTEAKVGDIITIAREHQMNIAHYDTDTDKYYVEFSLTDNPERIYGVDTNAFVYDVFAGDVCASTLVEEECTIKLSSPNKTRNIIIYPLGQLEDDTSISNLIVYPDSQKTTESNIAPLKDAYPNASTIISRQFPGGLLPLLVIIFFFANVLILLSLLQTIYRSGKEIGTQKLFGKPFVERCLAPVIVAVGIVASVLVLYYTVTYHVLTFDWSYLQFVALYFGVTFAAFSVSVMFVYVSINRQDINLLVKGMQRSKFLMGLFMVTCLIALTFSGVLIPLVANQVRNLNGLYKGVSFYQSELAQAGTLMLTAQGGEALMSRDPVLIEQYQKLRTYFGEHIYYKYMYMWEYMDKEGFFPLIEINEPLVHKYFGEQAASMNFTDEQVMYIFTSNGANNQEQVDDIKKFYSQGEHPVQIFVIEYDNPELREFMEEKESGRGYNELVHPMYTYRYRGALSNTPFTTRYGFGAYIGLDTEEGRAKWGNVKKKLSELGLTDYHHEPTTLEAMEQSIIQSVWYFIFGMGVMFILTLFGVLLLMQTCLQEYFRINRKRLVLSKVFGQSFATRYGVLIGLVLVVFIGAWLATTIAQREWFLLNGGIFIVLLSLMYAMMRYGIRKLEGESMNIIIKE